MADGFKVTIAEDDPNITTYEIPTRVIGTETLWEKDVKKIKFDRYWDSHGKKVYWDDEPCWEVGPCHVRIDVEHRIHFEKLKMDVWRMYINGKEVQGGIEGYNYSGKTGLLKIDAPFGSG